MSASEASIPSHNRLYGDCVTLLTTPMDEKCTQLWQKLSAALKPHVSADTFKRWFSAVELAAVTPKALSFRVPNNIYQYWIESNHMAALEAAVLTALGEAREIKFISSESPVQDLELSATPKANDSHVDVKPTSTSSFGLNPRNTDRKSTRLNSSHVSESRMP